MVVGIMKGDVLDEFVVGSCFRSSDFKLLN